MVGACILYRCVSILAGHGHWMLTARQILFARMSITIVLSCLYMWYTKVPHFPFGDGKVRGLLVARGMAGFFGVYGLYCMCKSVFPRRYHVTLPDNHRTPSRFSLVPSDLRGYCPDFYRADNCLLGLLHHP